MSGAPNLRPVRNAQEAILLAQDISAALIAARALGIHGCDRAAAVNLDIARQALEGLNEIAPSLGIGPKVIDLDARRPARAVTLPPRVRL